MKKLFTSVLALLAAVCLYATDLNIYASGLKATQSGGVTTIEYVLNAQATSLNVLLYNGTSCIDTIPITGASNLSQGAHTGVTIDLSSVAEGEYTWALEASGVSNTSTTPKEIAYPKSVQAYTYYLPQDVEVDNNPQSPYFGNIYVSESTDGANDGGTATNRIQTRGIYIYNPDLTFLNGLDSALVGYDGGLGGTRTARAGFRRLAIDEDGFVYVDSRDDATKGVYRMNPANPSDTFTTVLSASVGVEAIFIKDNALTTLEGLALSTANPGHINTYSLSSIPVGTPSSSIDAYNPYRIGINASGKTGGSDLASDGRGGWWITQSRWGFDTYPALIHLKSGNSVSADFQIKENENTALLSNVDAGISYRGSIAINTTGDLLAIGSNKRAVIFSIEYDETDGTPTLTKVCETAALGSNIDGIAFDVANNLYVVSASSERFYAFALKNEANTFTTPAKTTNKITWNGNVTHVENVSLNHTNETIVKNETMQLTVTINPSNATNTSVTWESNNTLVATVSDNGLVTAVGPGEADITVKSVENEKKTATCHFVVTYTAVTGVSLNKPATALFAGYKETLTATIEPNDATEPEVSWESLNSDVAIVSNAGEVTAVTPGEAQIVVKSVSNPDETDTCVVTVSAYSLSLNTYYLGKNIDVLAGKTIRRVIANGRDLFVLALNGKEPYLYRINTRTDAVQELPTDFCLVEDENGLKLSDIAMTSDGVLVGCNKEKCTTPNGTPNNKFKAYKWVENNGEYNGVVWFTETDNRPAGNFSTAYAGESMTYVGSSIEGKLVATARTTGSSGAIRLNICTIAESQLASQKYNRSASPLTTVDLGGDFQLNVLSDGETYVLDGSVGKPIKFTLINTEASGYNVPTSLLIPSAQNKAMSNFINYDGRNFALTTHYAEAQNDGFVMNEVINGLAPAINLSVPALTAKTATFAAAVGSTVGADAFIYVLRDNELSVFSTADAPVAQLYEFDTQSGDWKLNEGEVMERAEENVFTTVRDFSGGDRYITFSTLQGEAANDWDGIAAGRISAIADGDNYWITGNSVTANFAQSGGKCYMIPTVNAGRFRITVDFYASTVTFKKLTSNVYVYQTTNSGQWDLTANEVMADNPADDVFEDVIDIPAGEYLILSKAAANNDWNTLHANQLQIDATGDYWLNGDSKANLVSESKNNSFFAQFGGYYKFRVDLNTNQVTITQLSAYLPVTSVGYATYYNSAKAYTMPAGMEGYVFNAVDELVLEYEAGDVVPAGVGLVLKAAEGNYELEFSEGGVAPTAENNLLGTDETVQIEDDANYNFYALSLDQNGQNVGFYWMIKDENADRGAAFVNGAHKAYLKLAINAIAAPQRFYLFHGENNTTDILNVKSADEAEKFIENGQLYILRDGVIYDATGRRVR